MVNPINLNHSASFVELTVKDEGPGIEISEQAQLFTPYGITSTIPHYGENKTGLGLAIVKKVAEALKAEVGCRSEKGRGCEFYIRLFKTGKL